MADDEHAPGHARGDRWIGLSLDVGRKAFSVEGTIGLIRRMGELGLTALRLHLTETDRVGIALPGFEELAAEDAWTARDAARLVAAAEEARVTLVPEIDLPSHAAALLVGREHLRLVDRHGTVHPDRLDISLPEARQFALDLLDGAARLFPGEWLHLGGDEFFAAPWEDEDARRPDRFPSLVDHARAAHGPEATALDCYADFMNELSARALELGRTPILWNDHVVPAREAPLVPITTEAVLDVWIRWREWTPSVTDYLDSGYRVLNSNGDLLYMVLSADDPPAPHGRRRDGLLEDTFAPHIDPAQYLIGFSFYEENDDWNEWNDTSEPFEESRAVAFADWQPGGAVKGGIFSYAVDRDGVAFKDDTISLTTYEWSRVLKERMLDRA